MHEYMNTFCCSGIDILDYEHELSAETNTKQTLAMALAIYYAAAQLANQFQCIDIVFHASRMAVRQHPYPYVLYTL